MAGNLRRFVPRTRMGIFTLVLVVLWLAKSLIFSTTGAFGLDPSRQVSLDFFTFLLAVPAVYYSWRLFRAFRARFLWKIRRRLLLAHIFIGGIPLLVVFLILYVSALLFLYQFNYYLIVNQIGINIAQVHAFNLTLRAGLEQTIAGPNPGRGGLQALLDREVKYILGVYPSATIILHVLNRESGVSETFAAQRSIPEDVLRRYRLPGWVGDEDFSGLVHEDQDPQIYRSSRHSGAQEVHGTLFLRSLVVSSFRPESHFSIEVSVPFDRHILERLKSAIGQDLLLADNVQSTSLNVMLQSTDLLRTNVYSATFDLSDDDPSVSRPVWSVLLFPVSWVSGSEMDRPDTEVLFVENSSSRLLQNLFKSESNVGRTILGGLKIVIGFFLFVELISVVIGILLTKSITSAVHNLDRGTEFIKRGDFGHRVVVKSDDQLGALAKSFNQMTEYVQALVKERVQRERLERELEIAKEVQEQLFPRVAPRMKLMELTGLCLPARIVSGDYYDFLQFDSTSMGMALGDICGKGISAALLMANLQATLRSNVIHFSRSQSDILQKVHGEGAVAHLVKQLNEQIYSYTSANKFASFFYAVYDESRHSLTYCNAGHNPPLFFANGTYSRLSKGGTVVGIFSDAEFEQETIALHSGDLLVAYTDGIIESVNEYGEEFGEERLVQVIERNRDLSAQEIQKILFDEVLRWSYEEERDDDMTLIVGKIR